MPIAALAEGRAACIRQSGHASSEFKILRDGAAGQGGHDRLAPRKEK
ncbi:MAG: hypothetical protein ACTFAK_14300 [Candidatus Electronema sp. VV]